MGELIYSKVMVNVLRRNFIPPSFKFTPWNFGKMFEFLFFIVLKSCEKGRITVTSNNKSGAGCNQKGSSAVSNNSSTGRKGGDGGARVPHDHK